MIDIHQHVSSVLVANAGKLFFRRYYRDPRSNLAAFPVAHNSYARRGRPVDEGGWAVLFLEDVPLGGDFNGESAVRGMTLEWGEFVIYRKHRSRARKVLSFRSAIPPLVRLTPEGLQRGFQYELFRAALDDASNDWGNSAFAHEGLNQGIDLNPSGLGGEVTANSRHVLTFSDEGGL